MEYYLNQACVTYRELVGGGILTDSNYKQAVWRKKIDVVRKGGNGREALIVYDTMPEKIKEMYRRTYGSDVKEQALQSPLKKHYEVDVKAQDFFENYRYENGLRIKADKIQQYVANASALNAVNRLIKANSLMKRKAGGSFKIGEVYKDFILPSLQAFKTEWGHTLPKSERQLREVLKKYESGYEGLISGKDGNNNAAATKENEQHALLRRLLSHANNFDYAQVAMMYNEVGKANAWKNVSRKTVENFAKKNILLTEGGRRGEVAFDNKLAMQHRRRSAPYPMMLWTIDGWDAELLYQTTVITKDGKNVTTYHNRPTIVIVLDPYQKYPVGYAIGTHETPELIQEAVRNALNHTAELFGARHRPQQLQSDRYGNGKLTPFFEKVTAKYVPARVKNAKAKVIEPYFKDINKAYCQFMNNWSGFGVTSKIDNQPNVEYRNKIRHSFPDWQGVCDQLHNIIAREREQKRDAFVEGFNNLSDIYRLPWTTEQYLRNVGIRKERTIKMRGTFQFDIEGVEYHYDSFEQAFRYNTHEDWTLCYDTQDMSNVLVTNKDESLGFLLQPVHMNAMYLKDRQEGDAEAMARVDSYNKALKSGIMEQTAQDYDLIGELFRNTEQETLSKMLLIDSLGQHKLQKAKARLKPPPKERVTKEIEAPMTDLEHKYNKHLEKKNNYSDYL